MIVYYLQLKLQGNEDIALLRVSTLIMRVLNIYTGSTTARYTIHWWYYELSHDTKFYLPQFSIN